MIGLNYLGKLGQLGNQMFQYASLRGIATWKGYEYVFPNHSEVVDDGIGNKLRIELFDAFKIKHSQYGLINTPKEMHESHFHFDENLFNNCPDDACLIGFFQTPKYFDHIQDQIRKDFEFKDEYVESCKELIDEFESNDDTSLLTNPDIAKKFVEETKVDFLGFSIGNVHIHSKGKYTPNLKLL